MVTKISKLKFDACIFDLDGVITQTQGLHFSAWKKVFNDFLKERGLKKRFNKKDYLKYVDGKLITKGVKSFLDAIDIKLPLGKNTGFGFNSIYGIANIKNRYFESILEEKRVKVFKPTIRFIKKLKNQNFKLAVGSANKYCKAILKKAGIYNLFNVVIDGDDSERLKLKGKLDVFEEAARRLKVRRERCIIVEDSTAGIQAGKKGGFGFLIGIDRGGNKKALFNACANIVVKSLGKVYVTKSMAKGKDELVRKIKKEIKKGKKIFLFTDYDGTLTPIVDRPELALLSKDMKKILQGLAKKIKIVIMSGRSLTNIKKFVGLKMDYSGDHGFEIEVNNKVIELEKAKKFLPVLAKAERILGKIKVKGFLLEKKRFSLACHYRLVKAEEVEKIKKKVKEASNGLKGLKLKYGKKVIELMPRINWGKGKALEWIMKKLNVSKELIIYMGDDLTDEDAFKVVNSIKGISILVVSKDAYENTSAKYFLKGIKEAKEFLIMLNSIL